jgi:hypothetical protein
LLKVSFAPNYFVAIRCDRIKIEKTKASF